MPNRDNIASPLTIISYGRSGTSLLSSILERSEAVDFVGETAQLIFSVWRGAETSSEIVRRDIGTEYTVSPTDFCAAAVRAVFLEVFPSQKPLWLQKPIGIPECFWWFKETGVDAKTWYWNALKNSFPDGKYLTILRNPIDVAVSAYLYWGFSIPEIVAQLGEIADIITHPDSLVEHAVVYDEIMANPKKAINGLCKYLNIAFKRSMLGALYEDHVPQDPQRRKERLTSQAVLEIIGQIKQAPEYSNMLHSTALLWRKFGVEPQNFYDESRYVKNISGGSLNSPLKHWRDAHDKKLAALNKAKTPARWGMKLVRRYLKARRPIESA